MIILWLFQVVYFTATYPLGILVVFLIRGLTTPGFNEGIDYYIIPKWEKLLNVEVSFYILNVLIK